MSGRNLFVAPLEPSVTDEELVAAFSPFGTIVSAKVMKDIHRGNPRGFGFVLFSDPSAASLAVHNHQTRWKVQYASHDAYNVIKKSRKVYARNIPSSFNEIELRNFFGQYGTVTSIVTKEDSSKTPQPFNRQYGAQDVPANSCRVCFVEFATEQEAAVCVKSTEGFKLPSASGPLLTKFAETPDVRDQRRQRQRSAPNPQSATIVPSSTVAMPVAMPPAQQLPQLGVPVQSGHFSPAPLQMQQFAVQPPPTAQSLAPPNQVAVLMSPTVLTAQQPQQPVISDALNTSTNSNSSGSSLSQPVTQTPPLLFTLAMPSAPIVQAPLAQPFILSPPTSNNLAPPPQQVQGPSSNVHPQ